MLALQISPAQPVDIKSCLLPTKVMVNLKRAEAMCAKWGGKAGNYSRLETQFKQVFPMDDLTGIK